MWFCCRQLYHPTVHEGPGVRQGVEWPMQCVLAQDMSALLLYAAGPTSQAQQTAAKPHATRPQRHGLWGWYNGQSFVMLRFVYFQIAFNRRSTMLKKQFFSSWLVSLDFYWLFKSVGLTLLPNQECRQDSNLNQYRH